MPFEVEKEEKQQEPIYDLGAAQVEIPPAEEPPEEPPETPPEPTVKSLQAEIKDLKGQRDHAARGGRKKAEQELAVVKAELQSVKRKAEAGERPTPPQASSFTDPTSGEIDYARFNRSQVEYEDKVHAWRQAQGGPTPAEPVLDPSAGVTHEEFITRAAPMKEKYTDFDEVINRPVFSEEMSAAIRGSDQGPDIAYHLGKNEAESLRIAELPTAQMLKEIGKLEGRFSAESTKRTISGAPPPISPVTGVVPVEKDPEKMSTAEWMAHNKAREIKKIKEARTALGG